MSVLKVDYGTFENLHTQCERARVQLDQTINDMNSRVGKNLAENWQGDGKDAYLSAQQKWNTAAQDLYDVLKQVEASVDSCGQNFAYMENNQIVPMF